MSKISAAGAKKNVGFGAAPSVSKFKRVTGSVGEDLPALKRIAKEIKGQNLTVEDYILLVGPHTGDKAAALTKVMNEDLTSFRRMVTKVYDTMTKDASDVMANTQIELGQLYSEKQRLLVDNMIRSLQRIKNYVPEFDFQQYFQDPDKYLSNLFRLADIPDDEEREAAKRQLAYHRLQWLQSEGERLQAENIKLEERLGELQKVKRKQITEALTKEQEVERKREELEQKQEEMQNEFEEVCDELHEAIITEEKKTMDTKKEKKVKILAKKKAQGTTGRARQLEKKDWNVKVAAEYSKAQLQGEASANRSASDRQQAVKWMRKLSTSNNSVGEMKLRNDFMYYLVLNIQNGELKDPFTGAPPSGTIMDIAHQLPRGADGAADLESGAAWGGSPEGGSGKGQQPFIYTNSPDGGAFLASQPIPRCGAFCYLAVVSKSKS